MKKIRILFAGLLHSLLFHLYVKRRLLVLCYHGVYRGECDAGINWQGKHIAAEKFRSQLLFLKNRGYRFIAADELVSICESDSVPASPLAMVTFDDGYRNNYTNAWPVLKELDIPAIVFVVSGFLESQETLWMDALEQAFALTGRETITVSLADESRVLNLNDDAAKKSAEGIIRKFCKTLQPLQRDEVIAQVIDQLDVGEVSMPELYVPLRWSDALEMHNGGFAVGGHTHTHTILTSMGTGQMREDIVKSKQLIDTMMKADCNIFAYPNGQVGDYDQGSKVVLGASGYTCAFSAIEGLAGRKFDRFEIRRIPVNDRMDMGDFILRITGLLGVAKSLRRWVRRLITN